MSTEDPKAIVQMKGDDVFIVTTPSGHAITIDTDSARPFRAESDGTAFGGPGIVHRSRCGFYSTQEAPAGNRLSS